MPPRDGAHTGVPATNTGDQDWAPFPCFQLGRVLAVVGILGNDPMDRGSSLFFLLLSCIHILQPKTFMSWTAVSCRWNSKPFPARSSVLVLDFFSDLICILLIPLAIPSTRKPSFFLQHLASPLFISFTLAWLSFWNTLPLLLALLFPSLWTSAQRDFYHHLKSMPPAFSNGHSHPFIQVQLPLQLLLSVIEPNTDLDISLSL